MTYYPDEFEDDAQGIAAWYGTPPGGYGAPPAPAPPQGPPPPKPGDPWPGKCPKCGNERVVVWRVDWPRIDLICKLCGFEKQVKHDSK